jgi:acyl-CoA hydrolase
MLFLFLGDTVFVQGAAATPNVLLEAMAHHGKENNLKDITVIHMHTEGPAYYAQPEYSHIFRSKSTFMGGNVRKAVAEGRADSIPIFLHEIPLLFRRGLIPIDVALIQVRFTIPQSYCKTDISVFLSRLQSISTVTVVWEHQSIV